MSSPEDSLVEMSKPRCLFCASTTAKRSREHVLRRSFKQKFASVSSLTFARQVDAEIELAERPITQFDLTVNDVCRDCNQGWLNDLENLVEPSIDRLIDVRNGRRLSSAEIESLGYWAFVRSMLLTHLSPRGRVPRSLFERVYRDRRVPTGCYVQLAISTHSVFEAGSHQSIRLNPGDHYLGFVAFGLGPLVFFASLSDSSPETSTRSLDVSRQPRFWFPGCFRWLSPPELLEAPLRILTGVEAQMAGMSLAFRTGAMQPMDQLGQSLDPRGTIPDRFLPSLAWKDVGMAHAPATNGGPPERPGADEC